MSSAAPFFGRFRLRSHGKAAMPNACTAMRSADLPARVSPPAMPRRSTAFTFFPAFCSSSSADCRRVDRQALGFRPDRSASGWPGRWWIPNGLRKRTPPDASHSEAATALHAAQLRRLRERASNPPPPWTGSAVASVQFRNKSAQSADGNDRCLRWPTVVILTYERKGNS